MFRTKKTRPVAAFACCLAALTTMVIPAQTAHAWLERTLNSRALDGSGCLIQMSGLGHGSNPEDPFNVFNQANFRGMTFNTSSGVCNADLPSDSNPLLFGEFYNYLVVQISDGPDQDTYFHCTEWWSGALSGTTIIEKSYNFGSAPCGAGWYALVSCMYNVGAFTTSPWSEGYFTPTDLTHCNVTPRWHPVGFGPTTVIGEPVNL